ncbi:zinc finger CCCH domain-containing protein 2-like [Malania oleifera]|uniref:zinc finger CCCH domain-containing protein 2-like n=1 Tax=Malania oleifera TaxID=397392 RepID=UPI0025AE5BD0|nr:zinc finger CCCH domain-containing protein 2-like [Malania oleifera]
MSSSSSSVCAEHNKFHPSHQLLSPQKTLRPIDIPPRKLLSHHHHPIDIMTFSAASPRTAPIFPPADESLLLKFLSYNSDADGDPDPYASDHFRMFEFKIRRCTRSRSHDWTDCPFAHPGEKARRRDLSRHHYAGTVCPDFRRGGCSRGDDCEFAHGVFECWLHPARYRTEPCKDGKNCKRKVCFFAHTPQQLRVLPPQDSGDRQYQRNSAAVGSPAKQHCCFFCHSINANSPTSTLMDMSNFSPSSTPPLSPPVSPANSGRSGGGFVLGSQSRERRLGMNGSSVADQISMLSYKNVLTELISSLEAINLSEASSLANYCAEKGNHQNQWINNTTDIREDEEEEEELINNKAVTSSTPNGSSSSSSTRDFLAVEKDCGRKGWRRGDERVSENGWGCPDLGWVNDLLM